MIRYCVHHDAEFSVKHFYVGKHGPKKQYRSYRCREVVRREMRERRDPVAIRDRQLRREYGISYSEYLALLESQGGGCAMCGGTDSDRELAVDHDHLSGRVRGLLCMRCNGALGRLRDEPTLAEIAAEYLRANS